DGPRPAVRVDAPPRPDLQNPEGQRVAAVICLGVSSKIGDRPVNVTGLLDTAARQRQVPMVFFYGEGDDKGKKLAKSLEKQFKPDKKADPTVFAVEVPKAEKLTGSGLLAKSLGTTKAITEFLEEALKGKNTPLVSRPKSDDVYVWQWQASNGRVMQVQARPRGMPMVLFSTYDNFLR